VVLQLLGCNLGPKRLPPGLYDYHKRPISKTNPKKKRRFNVHVGLSLEADGGDVSGYLRLREGISLLALNAIHIFF
jgi:hypothetical protein